MKPRVFIDTNTFIFAKEFPKSNSAKIIELLNNNHVEAIVSEKVLQEVYSYFRRFYSKDFADKFRFYLLQSCQIIYKSLVSNEMNTLRGKIKIKDLEQIATVKNLGLKYLISYDRDFKPFPEYITPKQFVKLLNLKPASTVY